MYKRFIAVVLIGITIKIMDDYLDRDIDKIINQWNITFFLNRSIIPYTLLLFMISLYLNFSESSSFFISSYIIGMTKDNLEKLQSKLYAWQESIIVFLIGIIINNLKIMLSSLILIYLIQLFDDLIDYQRDSQFKANNFSSKIGIINTIILISILLLFSLNFFLLKTLHFLLAVVFIYLLFYCLKIFFGNDLYDN
ncbi:hypothetical protein [Natronospora cellulosivora (SeqCode)]